MNIAAAMQAVADELTAGGVRATIDGADVHPPCVLIRPPIIHYRFAKGTYNADWRAWVMVPANGIRPALNAVSRLLDDAQTALGHYGVTASPGDVNLNDGGTVPMYELAWTTRIPA